MKLSKYFAVLVCLGLSNFVAQADGLNDMKNALNRLQGNSQINAELASTTLNNRDEKITKGEVKVWLKDDETGLQVLYSDDILEKMELEARQRIEDEDAETVTLNAIDRINATELHEMLSAASSLLRRIDQAQFVDEQQDQYKDETVRLLRFNIPVEQIIRDKKTRSYVSKFSASYTIWIDDDGTPLQTRLEYSGKGRAYLFFKITASGSETAKYQVVDDRLVMLTQESNNENDTSFGVYENQEMRTLQVQENELNTAQLNNPD